MEERFYRPPEVARERRRLRAATYNLAQVLLRRSGAGHLFVPIRSMQYLAVLESEEFIFVDAHRRRIIELAWQDFERDASRLDAPVAYDAVFYETDAAQVMRRLPVEFHKALEELDRKRRGARGGGRLVRFPRGQT